MTTWNSSMTTGVESLDEQHRELFRQVNALKDAMTQGQGRGEIDRVLDFLGGYVQKHFAEEERWMTRVACPVAAANRAAHAEFLAKFKVVRERFATAGASVALVIETHQLLVRWLTEHINTIDRQLAAHVLATAGK